MRARPRNRHRTSLFISGSEHALSTGLSITAIERLFPGIFGRKIDAAYAAPSVGRLNAA
ncbi:hypothetical protein XFF6166_880063 [Xanthomonas citri pv. fuscans]|nr:hypothetical protein XFF6166_880063 [Xanthomonas citri pv. fuscans]SOO04417.1 hypothetical protein XFF6960_970063 [Xanthomonas citri pv. fuscans]SOO07459.1 hypothetical protein XFF7767_970035 [Xanthomonas citri pv. fuscans]SOO08116.1 hypothetical protein XFF6970_150059 [Xanthomonas citri pv. fuscans]SOO13483.1 hypothetical protein XFF7766_180056 [Xanthomonas citri pv. fuscans]